MAAKSATETKKLENQTINYLIVGKGVICLSYLPNKETARLLEGAATLTTSSNAFKEGIKTLFEKVSGVKNITPETQIEFLIVTENGEVVTTTTQVNGVEIKKVIWSPDLATRKEISALDYTFESLEHASKVNANWRVRQPRGRESGDKIEKPDDGFSELEA